MTAKHTILMLAFPQAHLEAPLQMFAGANDALGCRAYCLQIAAPSIDPFTTSPGVQLVAERRMDCTFARAVVASPTEFRARFKYNGGPNVSL